MQIIDLSKDLNESTFVLSESSGYTDPPIRFEPWATIGMHGYSVTSLHMGLHAGTHCDVSSHYVQGGRTISDFPVSDFVGWAVVLNLRGKGLVNGSALAPYQKKVQEQSDAVVIIRNSTDDLLTHEGREVLASWRPKLIVSGAGWNTDENYYESDFFHRADIPIVMNPNLDALDEVRDGDLIVALPLKFIGLEGSPIRLVAIRGIQQTNRA